MLLQWSDVESAPQGMPVLLQEGQVMWDLGTPQSCNQFGEIGTANLECTDPGESTGFRARDHEKPSLPKPGLDCRDL